jgi:hypothetical protein
MTRNADAPTTRELARWLLAHEAEEAGSATPDAQAAARVCNKLRHRLTTLAGAAGFRSLLARALTLAKKESALFAAWEVKPDGSLEGSADKVGPSGAVLVAQLIGLMFTFIGLTQKWYLV